jgi:hypothetical protein
VINKREKWQFMPVEPTKEMLHAGGWEFLIRVDGSDHKFRLGEGQARELYKRMREAAPRKDDSK